MYHSQTHSYASRTHIKGVVYVHHELFHMTPRTHPYVSQTHSYASRTHIKGVLYVHHELFHITPRTHSYASRTHSYMTYMYGVSNDSMGLCHSVGNCGRVYFWIELNFYVENTPENTRTLEI